jgi:hypothetical protein
MGGAQPPCPFSQTLNPPYSIPFMDSYKESLAYWTTTLGAVVAFFGLVQSFTWLAGVGALLVTVSIMSIAYGRRQHQLLKRVAHRIEGRSIDSLNMASLQRGLNRSLIIQEVQNVATIRGADLIVSWECSGYCRATRESAIEFSVDTDNNVPFDELTCFAYDLNNDPERRHRIRPILVGPDGMSKKISVPFLAPLRAQQPFNIHVTYTLPGCMKPGLDYYTASLSFQQEQIPRYKVHLVFDQGRPEWVRVYECDTSGRSRLLRDLPPVVVGDHTEYEDIAQDLPAQSVRVYLFRTKHEARRAA